MLFLYVLVLYLCSLTVFYMVCFMYVIFRPILKSSIFKINERIYDMYFIVASHINNLYHNFSDCISEEGDAIASVCLSVCLFCSTASLEVSDY